MAEENVELHIGARANDAGDGSEEDQRHEMDYDDQTDTGYEDAESRNDNIIAHEDTKRLNRFRILLVVVLALVCTGICVGTYLVINKETSNDSQLSVSRQAKSRSN